MLDTFVHAAVLRVMIPTILIKIAVQESLRPGCLADNLNHYWYTLAVCKGMSAY